MEGLDLSALFGPKPVILTAGQLRSLLAHVEGTENGVGAVAFNDGAGTLLGSVIVGARPIPSESEPVDGTERYFDAHGGVWTADEDGFNSAVEANRELIDAEKAAQAAAEIAA